MNGLSKSAVVGALAPPKVSLFTPVLEDEIIDSELHKL
jgi:hypothetical protein